MRPRKRNGHIHATDPSLSRKTGVAEADPSDHAFGTINSTRERETFPRRLTCRIIDSSRTEKVEGEAIKKI